MNKFPNEINVNNKNNFKEYNYNRIIKLLRNDIYEHLLSKKEETDFFDVEKFCKKNNYNDEEDSDSVIKMVKQIREELHKLGWKTELSYGDTGLFIYSTEEKPANCW
jgi:hypothetical protein